jgi:diguanylate cyclase (GGDEF)-like protein
MKRGSLKNPLLFSQMPLTDELTHLYTRRGFLRAGAKLLDIGDDDTPWAFLLSIDVDHFQFIKHALGREAGNLLLMRTADTLRGVFRTPAVIGRLGGGVFAVLVRVAGPAACTALLTRLGENIDACNLTGSSVPLSLSGGFTQFDSRYPASIQELLWKAGQAMHKKRREKWNPLRQQEMKISSARTAGGGACGESDSFTRH